MQHDISGEAHTNPQLYLQHYHPMKEHPSTFTIIVTFAFKILFWLLLVLCSHGCRLASRKRSSLESCPSLEGSRRHFPDRMAGNRNYLSEPASSLMIHASFLPLWGCFRGSRLRKQLFPRKTRVEGEVLLASWKPQRQLLHRVLPWQKEQIRTNISAVWIPHTQQHFVDFPITDPWTRWYIIWIHRHL